MIRIGPAIAIAIVALHAIGCNTLGKQLNALNESTIKITEAVMPSWDKQCNDAAKTCAADCKRRNAAASQPTAKVTGAECEVSCEAYQACNKERAIFYAAVNGIHVSINYAIAFLQTDQKPKAQAILMKVVAGLADVYKLAQDAGWSL